MPDAQISKGERITGVLKQLGIERAYFAGSIATDVQDLVSRHPDLVAYVSLINPFGPMSGFDPRMAQLLGAKLQLMIGDQGAMPQRVRNFVQQFPGALLVTLAGSAGLPWDDVAVNYGRTIVSALADLQARVGVQPVSLPQQQAWLDDIWFSVQGEGPPLVLLPLALAPSQWDPRLADLSKLFCTIQMRGPHLGAVQFLEQRFPAPGFEVAVRSLFEEIQLLDGESVLEVGCGSGADTRWLARRVGGHNPITGLEISPYLLSEAAALLERDGLEQVVSLKQGSALELPFPDDSFDVAVAITVLEECDADRTLSEMVRVTKVGGRVAAAVRAEDRAPIVNLPLPDELRAKIERPGLGAGASPEGCADASLYDRFVRTGLSDCRFFPAYFTLTTPEPLFALGMALAPDEREVLQEAVHLAAPRGSLFLARTLHCAVGVKAAH
jgi:SAM-dependent methyltransferase